MRRNSILTKSATRSIFLPILLFILSSVFLLSCKKSKVPAEVIDKFESLYPDADPKWSHENDQIWVAVFNLRDNTWSARFTKDGKWIESKYNFNVADVPSIAEEYIHLFYGYSKVQYYNLLTNESDFISAEITNDSLLITLYFDRKGYIEKDDLNLAFNNLREAYLTAENIHWKRSGAIFRADFYVDDKAYSAYFQKDGLLLYSETKCSVFETPSKIVQSLKKYSDLDSLSILKKTIDHCEIYYVSGMKEGFLQFWYMDIEGNVMEDEQVLKLFTSN